MNLKENAVLETVFSKKIFVGLFSILASLVAKKLLHKKSCKKRKEGFFEKETFQSRIDANFRDIYERSVRDGEWPGIRSEEMIRRIAAE